jgi:hypothetical protein
MAGERRIAGVIVSARRALEALTSVALVACGAPAQRSVANSAAVPAANVATPGWQACLVTKPDLEADRGLALSWIPDGGYALVLSSGPVDGLDFLSIAIPLAAPPVTGATVDVIGRARYSSSGTSSGDSLTGTLATADGTMLELALVAKDELRTRFDPGAGPLHHLRVAAMTVRRLADGGCR